MNTKPNDAAAAAQTVMVAPSTLAVPVVLAMEGTSSPMDLPQELAMADQSPSRLLAPTTL